MRAPDPENGYSKRQEREMDDIAMKWVVGGSDWELRTSNPQLIGFLPAHNDHKDYDLMFEDFGDLSQLTVLDFGCGPGRNLVKYHSTFARIDGIDISQMCLDRAAIYLQHPPHAVPPNKYTLYKTNGVDLREVLDNKYDLIMSTICMQHISVHEIRYNIFKDMLRVLKPGGWITIQMGYGERIGGVEYYVNFYDAEKTNGYCDVRVREPGQLEKDLAEIGYTNFQFTLRPVGPGDGHTCWIFFRAQKPQ